MDLSSFFRQCYEIKQAMGISCTISTQGLTYQVVLLQRVKNGVERADMSHVDRVDDLAAFCRKYPKAAIGLHVQGRGVLTRYLQQDGGEELAVDQVASIFPSFAAEDYYYSSIEAVGGYWVSFIKIEQATHLMDSLLGAGIIPAQLFVGPMVADSILEHVNAYGETFTFGGHHIIRQKEQGWASYEFGEQHLSKFKIKIGLEAVDQHKIIAYAAAFHVLMASYIPERNVPAEPFLTNYEEQRYRLAFRTNSILLLSIVFILLAASSIVYSIYYQRNQALRCISDTAASLEADWQQQKGDIDRKDSVLVTLGWNGGISKAWLLDKLGESLDGYPDINITEININPLPETRTAISQTSLRREAANTLEIVGKCGSITSLNAWIRGITHSSWTNRVKITQYLPSEAHEDTHQIFRLNIGFSHAH